MNPYFYYKTEQGVTTLHCKALDEAGFVNHCFTTRKGGASKGYLASMNLSFSRETRDTVTENYRRLCAAEGFCMARFTLTDQVHDSRVRSVSERVAGMGMSKESDVRNTDGLITDLPQTPLAVFIADCAGVLLADPVHKAVAAVHSGWRGTLRRIAAQAVEQMAARYGTHPHDIIAAIGPCIGRCCYEVGGEVRAQFADAWGCTAAFQPAAKDKWMLDLPRANRMVLEKAGVRQIYSADICTKCHNDLFYSHRATAGKRGNMAAVIEIRRPV